MFLFTNCLSAGSSLNCGILRLDIIELASVCSNVGASGFRSRPQPLGYSHVKERVLCRAIPSYY
jgi:hypothetical protein